MGIAKYMNGRVSRLMPEYRFDLIVDVGANTGQSTQEYLDEFPDCRIIGIEPSPIAADKYRQNFTGFSNVELHQTALSSSKGTVQMLINAHEPSNRVVTIAQGRDTLVEIESQTGDDFMEALGIPHVSLLKIDTEGHDLEVLAGFSLSLRNQTIDFVQVECGVDPDNHYHVPLEKVKVFLESLGMRLFVIGNQSTQSPSVHLRRCDAIFVSQSRARPC